MKHIVLTIVVVILSNLYNPLLVLAHNIPTVKHVFKMEYKPDVTNVTVEYLFDRVIVHRYITTMDTNSDRTISEEEQKTWVDTYVSQINFKINNKEYSLENTKVKFPSYASFLTENAGIEIAGNLTVSLQCDETSTVETIDSGNFLSRDDDIYKFEHISKDCLTLHDAETKGNQSIVKIGKKYPGQVLSSTIEKKQSNLSWLSLSSENNLTNIQTFLSDKSNNTNFILLSICIAVVVGALHALTPGHGKTLIAAYLVGEKGTIKDAIILASTTTLTHTMAIYLLGALSLFATQYFLPEKIIPALETISALSILALGLTILFQRIREFIINKKTHEIITSSDHTALTHNHGGATHTHDLSQLKDKKISLRAVISLGFSGGIVPCPDALAIMIMSISLNKIVLGMILILFFSAGLAGVLVSLGIILVCSKTFFRKYAPSDKVTKFVPITSAIIITIAGVALTLKVVL